MAKRGRPSKKKDHRAGTSTQSNFQELMEKDADLNNDNQQTEEIAVVRTPVKTDVTDFPALTPAAEVIPNPGTSPPLDYSRMLSIGDGMTLQKQPIMESEGRKCAHIGTEDIKSELDYWNSAIICGVVGASPPFLAMQAFAKRIWHNVIQVSSLPKGLYMVKFDSIENRDQVLRNGTVYFDRKPVILKAWGPNVTIDRTDFTYMEVWARFPGLAPQYWGRQCLGKLGSLLGTPIRTDKMTQERTILNYARILIRMDISKDFPAYVEFTSEQGILCKQEVEYEWRPKFCTHCDRFGHDMENCRRLKPKQIWVRKQPQVGLKIQAVSHEVAKSPVKMHTSNTERRKKDSGDSRVQASVLAKDPAVSFQQNDAEELDVIMARMVDEVVGDPPPELT